ncbi:MAG TPA: hypothetical protein VFI25_14940 [Planctomycetota bacterium]|nr:hypothetical protein [Planctomycetota bacterium]
MPSRKEPVGRGPGDAKILARLIGLMARGLGTSPLTAREGESLRAAAGALFPTIQKGVTEAFRKRGQAPSPRVSFAPEGIPETITSFASLGFDLTASLGLEHPPWQGLEIGAYFAYDAAGYRDRLVWGVSGRGDKEWVERCVEILRPKRRPDEPFIRTGEPMYAGGEFGWYVLWAWDCTPEAFGSASEASLAEEIRARLENLVSRLVRTRTGSAAGHSRKRG